MLLSIIVEPPLDWPHEVNRVCITVVVLVSVTEPRTVTEPTSRRAATFSGQKLSTRALFMQREKTRASEDRGTRLTQKSPYSWTGKILLYILFLTSPHLIGVSARIHARISTTLLYEAFFC